MYNIYILYMCVYIYTNIYIYIMYYIYIYYILRELHSFPWNVYFRPSIYWYLVIDDWNFYANWMYVYWNMNMQKRNKVILANKDNLA